MIRVRIDCLIPECDEPKRTRGLCKRHYGRLMKGDAEIMALVPIQLRECDIEDCKSPVMARGFCEKHYGHLRRNGDPLRRQRAERGKGEWRLNPNGYMRANRPDHPNSRPPNGEIYQHTFVMSEHIGRPLRPSETVHHKNGIRHDNRLENLELWVSRHPKGQRVEDLVAFAREILNEYGELHV